MLWAIGRYDLHLSDDEFWSLSPVKYFALYERWERELDHADFMLAQICSVMWNSFRSKGKALKATDFMTYRRKDKTQQKRRQSVEEQMAIAKAITIAFGGTVSDKKHR